MKRAVKRAFISGKNSCPLQRGAFRCEQPVSVGQRAAVVTSGENPSQAVSLPVRLDNLVLEIIRIQLLGERGLGAAEKRGRSRSHLLCGCYNSRWSVRVALYWPEDEHPHQWGQVACPETADQTREFSDYCGIS